MNLLKDLVDVDRIALLSLSLPLFLAEPSTAADLVFPARFSPFFAAGTFGAMFIWLL